MSKEDFKDTLGARMKRYEAVQDTQLIPGLPLYARVDGRHFSKFTKGFGYPYKELAAQGKCGFELTAAMQKTAESILLHDRSFEASRDYCMPIKQILTLIPDA